MGEESNLSMNQNVALLVNVVYVLRSSTRLVHAPSALVIINGRTIDFCYKLVEILYDLSRFGGGGWRMTRNGG